MQLIYSSGFEMGLFDEWSATTGSVSLISAGQLSGAYSLRCGDGVNAGYVTRTIAGTQTIVLHIRVKFNALPLTDALILMGSDGGSFVGAWFVAAEGKIYAGDSFPHLGATGVAVTTGVVYQLDVKMDLSANPLLINVKVNGIACGQASIATGAITLNTIYVGGNATVDVIYDDYAESYTLADYPIPDILCAAVANPRAAGQYEGWDTTVPVKAATHHFENFDDPAGTAVTVMDDDYVEMAGSGAVAEIANLDSCSDIGLAANAVIDGVNVMIYAKGATDGTNGIRVRLNGVDYDTPTTETASPAWYSKYYAADPSGAAWKQASFDGFQAGKYTASHATDEFLYCVMVFVVYHLTATFTDYLGYNVIGDLSNVKGPDYIEEDGDQYTLAASRYATGMAFYGNTINSLTANAQMAIYDGVPDSEHNANLIASTQSILIDDTPGWRIANFSSPVLLPAGTYRLCINNDAYMWINYNNAGVSDRYVLGQSFGTWPNPTLFDTGNWGTVQLSLLVILSDLSGGGIRLGIRRGK